MATVTDRSFPADFPKLCPPDDAREVETVVYRYVTGAKVGGQDFWPHKLRFSHVKDWGSKACDACGLSVFTSLHDLLDPATRLPAIRKLRKQYPFIAKGNLYKDLGVIKHTASSQSGNAHHTVWLYKGTTTEQLSKVFQEVIPSAVE